MLYVFENLVNNVWICLDLFSGEKVGKMFSEGVEDDTVVDKNGKSIPFECVEAISVVRNFSKQNFTAEELVKFTVEQIDELSKKPDSHDFLVENKTGFHLEKNWGEKALKGTILKINERFYPLEDNRIYNKALNPAKKYLTGEAISMKEFKALKPAKPFKLKVRKSALQADIGDRFAVDTDSLDSNGQSAQLAAGAKASDEDIALGHVFRTNNQEGREAILRFKDYNLMQTCLPICGYLKEGPKKEWSGDWVSESRYNYLMNLKTEAKKSNSSNKYRVEVVEGQAALILELEEAKMRETRPTVIKTIQMRINELLFGNDGWDDGSTKALRPSVFDETDGEGIVTNQIKCDFVKIKGELTRKEREAIQEDWDILDPNEKRDFTMLIAIEEMVIGGKTWDLPVEVLREYSKYENDTKDHKFQSLERDYSVEDAIALIEA